MLIDITEEELELIEACIVYVRNLQYQAKQKSGTTVATFNAISEEIDLKDALIAKMDKQTRHKT